MGSLHVLVGLPDSPLLFLPKTNRRTLASTMARMPIQTHAALTLDAAASRGHVTTRDYAMARINGFPVIPSSRSKNTMKSFANCRRAFTLIELLVDMFCVPGQFCSPIRLFLKST
jgi:hypothetical protein